MGDLTAADWTALAGSLAAGLVLGLIYFGGLWYTIQAMTRSKRPGTLFLVSFAARLVVVLGAIYMLGVGDWRRMTAALVGMIVMRFVLTRLLGPPHKVAANRDTGTGGDKAISS